MRKDKPSRTAYKVALNIVTLGSKPGMDEVSPIDYNYILILLNSVQLHPTVDNCQYQGVDNKNIKPFSGKFRRSYRG